MSFSTMWIRETLSATSVSVVATCNKFLSELVELGNLGQTHDDRGHICNLAHYDLRYLLRAGATSRSWTGIHPREHLSVLAKELGWWQEERSRCT